MDCCARVASGHTAAEPTTSLIKSRRLICPPRLRTGRIVAVQTCTGKGPDKCPLWVKKQTYALQQAMSALPPIATAKAKFRKRPCPLYPPKADIWLLDYFVGKQAERFGDGQAKPRKAREEEVGTS